MDPETQTNEDAAMEAGFNSTTDDDQSNAGSSSPAETKAEAPAGQQEQQPADQPESSSSAPTVVDPFAGLPEAARKLLAEVPTLQAQLAATEDRARRAEGQVRSMQSRFDSLIAAPAPSPAPAPKLDKLQHAKETLGHDMPEVIDALDELAALLPKPQSAPPAMAPTAPAQATAQVSVQPEAQTLSPHLQALDEVRPDWFETMESADLKLWVTTQDAETRAAYARAASAGDVLKVLNGFDKYRQQLQTASTQAAVRTSRVAAAVVPTGHARTTGTRRALTEEEAMEQGFRS